MTRAPVTGTPEKKAPAVSVIIPTYNRAALIGEAIASVLNQSFADFELIIVDDGSTDDSASVILSFDDPRLIFLRQENRGRSAARNAAIARARGKYVAFLDSDDTFLADKLERQVAYMELHPEVGMVYTSALCIDETGNPLDGHAYVAEREGRIYQDVAFFRPVTITLPTVMVRREVLTAAGHFDEAMERFEDTDLWRRIAKRNVVGVMREATCRLRTHADNALESQNPAKIVRAIECYVAKVFQEDGDVGIGFLREGASRLCEYYGKALVAVPGWRRHGLALLKRAVVYKPARAPVVAALGLKSYAGSIVRRRSANNKTG